MTAVLAGSDFLRAPVLATARPEGFKEWHHFVVHGRGFRLLINFSLTNEVSGVDRVRLAPRVIVIAHDQNWTGAIERFDGNALNVSADLGELTIGGNRMTVLPDGYRVAIDLPDNDIRGELHFTSAESAVRGQQPTRGKRPDVLALRTQAARRGMATDQGPATTASTTTSPITTTTGVGFGGATTSVGHGAPFCRRDRETHGRWSSCR